MTSAISGKLGGQSVQSLLHPPHGKWKADHPGGANPNLSLTKTQGRGDGLGHATGVSDSRDSSAGIGVSAIGHHSPKVHGPEVSLGHLDRRSLNAICGEGSR